MNAFEWGELAGTMMSDIALAKGFSFACGKAVANIKFAAGRVLQAEMFLMADSILSRHLKNVADQLTKAGLGLENKITQAIDKARGVEARIAGTEVKISGNILMSEAE